MKFGIYSVTASFLGEKLLPFLQISPPSDGVRKLTFYFPIMK
jgi:hypothetical protein